MRIAFLSVLLGIFIALATANITPEAQAQVPDPLAVPHPSPPLVDPNPQHGVDARKGRFLFGSLFGFPSWGYGNNYGYGYGYGGGLFGGGWPFYRRYGGYYGGYGGYPFVYGK